jgi:putative ABC transport system permease protein
MIPDLPELGRRVRAWFRPDTGDRDFADELDGHLALLIEDNLRRGLSPADAERAARVRLGNAAALREQHRDARGLPMVDALVQDLRLAIRLIVRGRAFAAAAIFTLALGIGANTVGFTIVYAALVRSLPFEAADDLYVLSWNLRNGRRSNASLVELQEWRAETRHFAGLAGYSSASMNLSDGRDLPEQVQGTYLTANAFAVLRQAPALGRDFVDADERPGAEPVVIIGARIWRARYGADPGVLGRTLRVDGRPATIIGVMPGGQAFPESTEIWAPFVPTEGQRTRTARVLRVFGRLRDGAAAAEARAELRAIADQMIAAYPAETKDVTGLRLETFQTRFIGGAGRPTFLTVLGAVTFVLLIACANVANLLLSRASQRGREIAVRAALGATRWRIVRQLLIESLVLGVIGGTIGLALAAAALAAFQSQIAGSLPYWVQFRLDGAVFAYVAGVCVLTALMFGLAPALQVSKISQSDVLKENGRGFTGGRRTRRLGGAMVVAEIALATILLVGAGLSVRSFAVLYVTDLGFKLDGLMAMRVQLPSAKYRTADERRHFFDELVRRAGATPGVASVAVTTGVPPLDGGERGLEVEGRAATTSPPFVGTVTVTPAFFDVLGVPLLRGRGFDDGDGAPGAEAVIINDRLAQQFFPGEDPLGKRLRFATRAPVPGRPADVWRTVVGISPMVKQGSSIDRYLNAVVYVPFRQESPATASLLIRTAVPPGAVMDTLRREVQSIDADQPIQSMQTLAQILAADRWWQRTWGSVFGIIAAIALVLAAVGLYAVMAYSVSQRTQEIGVRLAVGANARQVLWLVLRRGITQIAVGLALGCVGSLALANHMPGGLEGITASDPIAMAIVAGLLAAVCLVACVVPARHATRVDPVVALRTE